MTSPRRTHCLVAFALLLGCSEYLPPENGETDAGSSGSEPTTAGPGPATNSGSGPADSTATATAGGTDTGGATDNGVRAVGSAPMDPNTFLFHVSGGGSCAVFNSLGSDSQVYKVDLTSGDVELVSADSSGQPMDDGGAELADHRSGTYVSDDCRYVVFQSRNALDSDAGDSADYEGTRTFVRDLMLEETRLISFVPSDSSSAGSRQASMSADGSRILFVNNIEGISHEYVNPHDLYLWERETGAARWLDVRAVDGSPLTAALNSQRAFLSGDGAFAFGNVSPPESIGLPPSLMSTWIRIDVETLQWVELEFEDPGLEHTQPDSLSVSADGRRVVYGESDPVLSGTDPGHQVYALDIETMTRTAITADASGQLSESTNGSEPRISADGRFVVLELDGDLNFADLDPGEFGGGATLYSVETGEWLALNRWARGSLAGSVSKDGLLPSVSGDGSVVVFHCGADIAFNEPPPNWIELCVWTTG